jgi:hypothetical protein
MSGPFRPIARAAFASVAAVALLAIPATAGMSDVLHAGNEKWVPNRTVPPGMDLVMVFGAPNLPGPFIFRARVPPHYKLPPHIHPDQRVVTVLSGVYRSGVGPDFDEARLEYFPPGSFYSTPGGVPHFSLTGDTESIIQEMGFGPSSGIDYVHPEDDPRRK